MQMQKPLSFMPCFPNYSTFTPTRNKHSPTLHLFYMSHISFVQCSATSYPNKTWLLPLSPLAETRLIFLISTQLLSPMQAI